MDLLKGKQIMVWTFMGNARIYEALRDNTDGAQDMFLSELVRIMEKYPWCNGIDILCVNQFPIASSFRSKTDVVHFCPSVPIRLNSAIPLAFTPQRHTF